jgi:hypothetical protein
MTEYTSEEIKAILNAYDNLTVGKLIEYLEKYPKDEPVFISYLCGHGDPHHDYGDKEVRIDNIWEMDIGGGKKNVLLSVSDPHPYDDEEGPEPDPDKAMPNKVQASLQHVLDYLGIHGTEEIDIDAEMLRRWLNDEDPFGLPSP